MFKQAGTLTGKGEMDWYKGNLGGQSYINEISLYIQNQNKITPSKVELCFSFPPPPIVINR